MARAVLLTGCDIGDRHLSMARAKEMISREVGEIILASAIYESESWGFDSGTVFLNQALVLETTLVPQRLLETLQSIEERLGRERRTQTATAEAKKYGSRTMDIDIMFYDDMVIRTDRLTIPHPLICNREFVLKPLREIIGDYTHPVTGDKIKEITAG